MKKVFIVGVGRSGTSLLQSMLASHSEITFLAETSMLRRIIFSGSIGRYNCPFTNAEKLWNDKKVKRLGLPSNMFSGDQSVVGIYNQITEYGATGEYVGDKDPKLIEYLPLLIKCFPDCLIVHIKRDPRDVLASKKKAEWSRGRSPFIHIAAGYAQERMFREFKRNSNYENVIEVIYEDLISNPEVVLRDMCSKMGLVFEPSMLDFGKVSQKLVSREEMQWKGETLGPLLPDNFNKWKTELSPLEIFVCERVNSLKSSSQITSFAILLKGVICIFALMTVAPAYNLMRKYSYRKFLT